MSEAVESDRAWNLRVAEIAVGTAVVAQPTIVDLSPEQVERWTKIVAEGIVIRLTLGDRLRRIKKP